MDFNNLSLVELLIARVKCDKSLMFFTRLFFRILRGSKFIQNWHHEDICEALEKSERYEAKLVNINMPPRFSKTELAGINYIARGLSKNAKANYLYITASDELRSETSIRIRDIVTHPYYNQMYGVELKKDQSGKNLWRTNQGGGLKTATIFGQITGFGAGRMVDPELLEYLESFQGAIILDDINKIIDALSDNANNKKAIDTIFSTILSRVNSSMTPLINIQQRASENDASAALLDYFNADETINLVFPVVINGAPLWEYKLNMNDIEKLRTHHRTAHIFDTQYMQDPKPAEGVLFKKNKLNYFSLSEFNHENVTSKIGVVDTADGGTDYFSFPILKKAGDKWYLVDVICTIDGLEVTSPLSAAKIKEHALDYVKVETNNQGKDYYRYLKKNVTNTSIRGVWSVQNKETRILMQAGWIMENVSFRNDYEPGSDYDIFMTLLTKYLKMVKNQKDDAADSLAAAAQFIKKLFADG